MASSRAFLALFLLTVVFSFSSTDCRKAPGIHEKQTNPGHQIVCLYHHVGEPDATTTPREGAYAFIMDKILVDHQFASIKRRLDQSVPSPAAGH